MRGRVALYGPRHLLQLVALKRRQAAGRTLAEIQAELAGAPDETLASIAAVPGDLLTAADTGEVGPARPRFWAAPVVAAAPTEPAEVDVLTGVPLPGGAVLLVPGRPDAGDVAAIVAAAQPLISLLDARGLYTSRSPS
jgi:hypothetical protein